MILQFVSAIFSATAAVIVLVGAIAVGRLNRRTLADLERIREANAVTLATITETMQTLCHHEWGEAEWCGSFIGRQTCVRCGAHRG